MHKLATCNLEARDGVPERIERMERKGSISGILEFDDPRPEILGSFTH